MSVQIFAQLHPLKYGAVGQSPSHPTLAVALHASDITPTKGRLVINWNLFFNCKLVKNDSCLCETSVCYSDLLGSAWIYRSPKYEYILSKKDFFPSHIITQSDGQVRWNRGQRTTNERRFWNFIIQISPQNLEFCMTRWCLLNGTDAVGNLHNFFFLML